MSNDTLLSNKLIFLRPRHDYGSYRDLYSLIKLSGYPLQYVDEADYDSDNLYIFSSPQADWWTNFPLSHKARIVYYDFEFYDDFDPRKVPSGIELWSADPAYAKHHAIKYVMLGSHPLLAGYADGDLWVTQYTGDIHLGKIYDTILLAHMTWRRQQIQGQMIDLGLTVAPNEGLSGSYRHEILSNTRAMVHVHQRDNWKRQAPQRFALAAAYHMPLFSEAVIDMGLLNLSHVFYSDHDNLAQHVSIWIGRPNDVNILNTYTQALHQLLCHQYTFKKVIEAAV